VDHFYFYYYQSILKKANKNIGWPAVGILFATESTRSILQKFMTFWRKKLVFSHGIVFFTDFAA